jgi:hypothetical protein
MVGVFALNNAAHAVDADALLMDGATSADMLVSLVDVEEDAAAVTEGIEDEGRELVESPTGIPSDDLSVEFNAVFNAVESVSLIGFTAKKCFKLCEDADPADRAFLDTAGEAATAYVWLRDRGRFRLGTVDGSAEAVFSGAAGMVGVGGFPKNDLSVCCEPANSSMNRLHIGGGTRAGSEQRVIGVISASTGPEGNEIMYNGQHEDNMSIHNTHAQAV